LTIEALLPIEAVVPMEDIGVHLKPARDPGSPNAIGCGSFEVRPTSPHFSWLA